MSLTASLIGGAGRFLGSIWSTFSATRRQHNAECPDVLLKILHRGSGQSSNYPEWRIACFSLRNRLNEQLVATEIALSWSFGCRIAPANIIGDDWHIDKTKIGRTFKLQQVLRTSSGENYRQQVPFFVMHPRDMEDDGRHTVAVSLRIEHRTKPGKKWKVTLEGQIPQQGGDTVLFNARGPHT